jgi:hypothetical protein
MAYLLAAYLFADVYTGLCGKDDAVAPDIPVTLLCLAMCVMLSAC